MTHSNVTVIDHPLVQHKLTLMRKKETSTAGFRRLLGEISLLLGYEITRDLPLTMQTIETPLTTFDSPVLDGKKVVLVPILRAGLGFQDGMLSLIPSARVAHLGLYRDPETLEAVEYYFKAPENMENRDVIIVDPMLATGHSAVAAIRRVAECNPLSIKFLCLLAAPEGIAHVHEHFPEVLLYTGAIDSHLNEKGYIIPGLGDAGDRLYGTK